MTPVTIELSGESFRSKFEITEFSMLEPSTYQCGFRTVTGQVMTAFGLILNYKGDIDSLPPCTAAHDLPRQLRVVGIWAGGNTVNH
jgi:hypothetical protein